MDIGFIGLGSMGLPMARNLVRAGHKLAVYNRTRARADELRAEKAYIASSPAEAAKDADVLITMLADDAAVEEVIFGADISDAGSAPGPGHGAIHSLRRDATHVSMSTISVALSQRLAGSHNELGQSYVAAPVFGRPEASKQAKLWIIAGGEFKAIERVRPLFEAMGQGVFTAGEEASKANVIKLAGNFMIASMIEAMGEAFALARKSGVEAEQFLEIINGALFKSPIYESYGTLIAEERYEPAGFKLRLGLKDARLVLAAADAVEVPMPLASIIRDHYLSAVARGQGETDWAALARVSADNAGLESKSN